MSLSMDNSGNRTPSHPHCVDPVAASGITLTLTTAGADYTETLVGGQMYAITPLSAVILASITGATSIAANIEWVFPSNVTSIFRMPIGKTILYYESNASSQLAYLRKLA